MYKIINGECLDELKKMQDNSIDCVVTSPPYWALRDYGVEKQIGNEKTFEEYISNLCDIFDEVMRVLKKDGTCFVNIADTYSGTGNKKEHKDPKNKEGRNGQYIALNSKTSVKKKSLCCIPDRFKIEMINRGWICRNEIIWHKPNAMPSSVKDRFTVDYEKIFFFVKSNKYFFNQQKEKAKYPFDDRGKRTDNRRGTMCNSMNGKTGEYKNKRCVWSINTKPFKSAHFATYPVDLIEPIISSGCKVGGIVLDPFCGAGTTCIVANRQNKKCIGIELNKEYITIAKARINKVLNGEGAK